MKSYLKNPLISRNKSGIGWISVQCYFIILKNGGTIGMIQKTDIVLVLTEPDFQKRKRTLEWYYARLKQKKLIN